MVSRRQMTRTERYELSRAYLTQVIRLGSRVAALEERRAFYLDQATRITARYGAAPGGGGEGESRVERAAVKMAQLAEEAGETLELYAEIEREVREAVARVPDARYRDLLTYRYLNCWTWARIARAMHYTRDYVMHLHAEAMVAFVPPGPPRV